jgi:hypothetical protein
MVVFKLSLGVYNSYLGSVFQGDSLNLLCNLEINGQPVTADQVTGVNYTVQTPTVLQMTDGGVSYTLPVTEINFQSLEDIPSSGTVFIQDSIGVEEFTYTGVNGTKITGVSGGTNGAVIAFNTPGTFLTTISDRGTILDSGEATLLWTETQAIGPYIATAQFNLVTGEKRSVITSFTVVDPFNLPEPTAIDQITDSVWMRLEDVFDSNEGGPWLRDRTLNHFDKEKISRFIPEALFDINVQMPPTNYTIDNFTAHAGAVPNPNMPLLTKGVLVLTIRHLMRSYTEIFTPTGQGQLVWADRTRYQQAWGQIYQIEYEDYIAAVRLMKRTELRLGHSALLTLSKAGRLYPYSNYSTRGVYRGF